MSTRPTGNRRTTNTRQRKKQQHLLDVKIRASTERRRRASRIFSITCKLIIFSVLGLGSWIGGKEALRRFVWENPDYAIREVKFTTDGTLTREQILKIGDLAEGQNIFLVNLSKARAAIEKLPQVETAEVTRTLPNRLAINLAERRPIAWVVSKADEDPTVSEKAFLIDARGTLLKTKVRLEEYLHFPVISGVETGNFVPGERVVTSEMNAALELIRLTSESTRFQARHVDLAKGYCLVVTDYKRAKITFGLDRIEAQINRLNRYLARAAEDQREIQTVNLLVERNTPVTFVDPTVPEGETDAAAGKPVDPKAKPGVLDKGRLAVPIPKAVAVATPAASATPKAGFLSASKDKTSPTPAPRAAEGPKKQPFRLTH
ncbi:MAG: hypothetical protein QOE70_4491 [Chthoniobacter sp.]|jgi:cell division protein FtsQ|nr:hypothetical protein [Chthoniobacter sp.]